MPDSGPAPGASALKAPLVLVAAIAICALLVWLGPMVAEAMLAEDSSDAVAETWFTVVIFGGLLVAGVAGARLSGVNALALGPKAGASAALGFAIGFVGVVVAAGYGWIAGTLTSAPAQVDVTMFVWGTLLMVLQAGSEEVYFRGWLQRILSDRWGPAVAIAVAAFAFALLHIIGGARSPVTIVNLFLGGALFGLLTQSRGGIAAAVAGHIAWNWTEAMLLGLSPNPGVGSFGTLLDYELVGSALWGGSEEGLNASLAMTFALALFVVPLLVLAFTRPAASAPGRSGPAPA